MKLKELPKALWMVFKLSRNNAERLKSAVDSVLPVIVSLTSIPSRLPILHLVVRSLFLQTKSPELIVLWLHKDLQNKLPSSLTALVGDRFQIRFVEDTFSHRKLIYSLVEFPERVIVTCDDDLMYDPSWLARLWDSHCAYPRAIIAHECRVIQFDNVGEPAAYAAWKTASNKDFTHKWLMPIGYGGVLYPPHSLHQDVTNKTLFLSMAPKADDLWFKAMSHLAGTETRRSIDPGKKPIPIPRSQKDSLKKTNVKQNGNYLQWKAICEHYGIKG